MEDHPTFQHSAIKCNVCLTIILEETKLCMLGHTICNTCAVRNVSRLCPSCRSIIMQNSRNYQLEELIKEIKNIYNQGPCISERCEHMLKAIELQTILKEHERVDCKFTSDGCSAKLKLSEIHQHESACSFRTTPCIFTSNGCSNLLKLEELRQHEFECEFRQVNCVFTNCEVAVKLADIKQHELNCDHRLISCKFTNNGCQVKDVWNNITDHEIQCESRITLCAFTEKGCDCKGPLLDMDHHEVNCTYRKIRCQFTTEGCGKYFAPTQIQDHEIKCPVRTVKCIYTEFGCNETLPLKEIDEHELNCIYKSCVCVYFENGCQSKLKVSELLNHEKTCRKKPNKIFVKSFDLTSISCSRCNQLGCVYCKNNKLLSKLKDHIKELDKYFTFECKFAKDGCNKILELLKKEDHEEFCDFRDVTCKLYKDNRCNWRGCIKRYEEHLTECHSCSGRYKKLTLSERNMFYYTGTYNFYEDTGLLKTFKRKNKFFYLMSLLDENEIYLTIQCEGSEQNAENYKYELKLTSLNDETVGTMMYGGQCITATCLIEDAEKKNKSVFTKEQLNLFADKYGNVMLTTTIGYNY